MSLSLISAPCVSTAASLMVEECCPPRFDKAQSPLCVHLSYWYTCTIIWSTNNLDYVFFPQIFEPTYKQTLVKHNFIGGDNKKYWLYYTASLLEMSKKLEFLLSSLQTKHFITGDVMKQEVVLIHTNFIQSAPNFVCFDVPKTSMMLSRNCKFSSNCIAMVTNYSQGSCCRGASNAEKLTWHTCQL